MKTRVRFLWPLLACAPVLAGGKPILDERPGAEEAELASLEAALGPRIRSLFGPDAFVRAVFPGGLLGIGLEPLPAESDALPPVALATFDSGSDILDVLDGRSIYREAHRIKDAVLVVLDGGELMLLDGRSEGRIITGHVRGDLSSSEAGDILALTLSTPGEEDGETAVAVTDLEGKLEIVADAEGVDDRPSISPDGRTVVFVSGRTGIASFFRTTTKGAPPVQLTNAHIEPGVERDSDPEGYVPPPVNAARIAWLSAYLIRYDAGGGEYWQLDVRTGEAVREEGAR